MNLSLIGLLSLIIYISWKEVIPLMARKGLIQAAPGEVSPRSAGIQSVEFWQMQMQAIINRSISEQVTPILVAQTGILTSLSRTLDRLVTIQEMEDRRKS